jgi:hypothetical protein
MYMLRPKLSDFSLKSRHKSAYWAMNKGYNAFCGETKNITQ